MSELSLEQMWDTLREACGAEEQTLQVMTSIHGYNEKTLCDVLYALTAYRSFEQLEEASERNSLEQVDRLEDEIEAIGRELSRMVGLGGRRIYWVAL